MWLVATELNGTDHRTLPSLHNTVLYSADLEDKNACIESSPFPKT
jgi:hypothetical protein